MFDFTIPKIENSNKTAKPKKNSFLKNNVINPFLNSSVVTTADVVENIANTVSKEIDHKDILPVTKEYKVDGAKTYSLAWFTQNIASGVGMILPYAAAGLITHESLSSLASASGIDTGVACDKALQNLSTIAGAGAIGYFGPLKPGQTRLSNLTSNITSFSVFVGGNSLIKDFSLPGKLLANAAIGSSGAIAGLTTQSLMTNDKVPSLNEVLSAGITGATFNSLFPLIGDLGSKSIDSIRNNINLPQYDANNFANIADTSIEAKPALGDLSSQGDKVDVSSFRNPEIAKLAKTSYDKASLDAISKELADKKTVQLNRYESGGHSAVTILDKPSLESAIGGLLVLQWDRDNIMQALAEYQAKFSPDLKDFNISDDAWKKGLSSSLKYQMNHQSRITDIIDGKTSGLDINARPHIRYDGVTLEDVNDPWGNAQNDALASINYLLFHAINEGHLSIDDPSIAPFAKDYAALLPNYFKTVHVWEDWDFGAWEDKRAEHASSIGMALAALREQKTYVDKNGPLSYTTNGKTYTVNSDDLASLITNCESKLKTLLPNEFLRSDDGSQRTVDAALINPLYLSALSHRPLIDDSMNDTIIKNIQSDLMGDIGIHRYPGDVWDGRINRNELPPNMAAQWTHVSPMISVVLSDMYDRTGNPDYLHGQVFHFNRALAAIDSDFKTPEAYIRNSDNTAWIADANKPLAWSQASLLAALNAMYKRIGH